MNCKKCGYVGNKPQYSQQFYKCAACEWEIENPNFRVGYKIDAAAETQTNQLGEKLDKIQTIAEETREIVKPAAKKYMGKVMGTCVAYLIANLVRFMLPFVLDWLPDQLFIIYYLWDIISTIWLAG
ncbi:MAG: hypothetical protein FWG63_08615 [Defluviitaleaceae bacterium]|nr:hypothetical protein [Defluviitaleaceae bacterium]